MIGLRERRDVGPGIGRARQAVIDAQPAHFLRHQRGAVGGVVVSDADGRRVGAGVVDQRGHEQGRGALRGPGLHIAGRAPSGRAGRRGRGGVGTAQLRGDQAGRVGLHRRVQGCGTGDLRGPAAARAAKGPRGPLGSRRLGVKRVGAAAGAHDDSQRQIEKLDGVGCGANAPSQAVCGGGINGVGALSISREAHRVRRNAVRSDTGVIDVELHRVDRHGRAHRDGSREGHGLGAAVGLPVGRGGQHCGQRVGQDGQDICRRESLGAVRIAGDNQIGVSPRRKHPERQQERRGSRPGRSRHRVIGVEQSRVGGGAAHDSRRQGDGGPIIVERPVGGREGDKHRSRDGDGVNLGGGLPAAAVGHNRMHRVAAHEERAKALEVAFTTVSIGRPRQDAVGVKTDGEWRGSARHDARRANVEGPVKAAALRRIGERDGKRIDHGERVGRRSRPRAKAASVGHLGVDVVGAGGQAAQGGREGSGGEGSAGLVEHRVARSAVGVEPHDVRFDAGDHGRIGRNARPGDEHLAVDRRSYGDIQHRQRRGERDVVEGVIAVGIRAILIQPDEVELRRGRPRQASDAEVGRDRPHAGQSEETQGVPTVGRARGAVIDAMALVDFRRSRGCQPERVGHIQAGDVHTGVVDQCGHEQCFPVARGLGANSLVAGAPVGQGGRSAPGLGRERRRDACRADGGHAGVHFRHGLSGARAARHRISGPLERRGRRVERQGQACGGNLDRADRGEGVGSRPRGGRAVGRLRVNLVSPFGECPQRGGECGKRPRSRHGSNRPAGRVGVEGHGIGIGRRTAGHRAGCRE